MFTIVALEYILSAVNCLLILHRKYWDKIDKILFKHPLWLTIDFGYEMIELFYNLLVVLLSWS